MESGGVGMACGGLRCRLLPTKVRTTVVFLAFAESRSGMREGLLCSDGGQSCFSANNLFQKRRIDSVGSDRTPVDPRICP